MNVAISHLTKQYGKLRAVNDVSISMSSGQCYALVGPNEAGKNACSGTGCGSGWSPSLL